MATASISTPSYREKALHCAAGLFLGGLIAWIAWVVGVTQASGLIVLVWAATRDTKQAWLTVFGYYLAGSYVVPGAFEGFFGSGSSPFAGYGLWFLSSVLLSLPWAVAHRWSKVGKSRLIAAMAALVVVSVPPIGLFGWLNPAIGFFLITQGHGAASLLAGAAFMSALVVCSTTRRRSITAFTAFALCAALSFAFQPPVEEPEHWIGMNPRGGSLMEAKHGEVGRYFEVASKTRDFVLTGQGRAVAWPETFVGEWSDNAASYFEDALGQDLRESAGFLLVGTEVPKDGKHTNSLKVYDGHQWQQADAVHAVPVASWRPWSDEGIEVDWLQENVHELAGQRVWLSICFEDYIVWPHLRAILAGRPDLLLAIANGWWAKDAAALEIQRHHVEAWARIAGVPLLRSINYPAGAEK